MPYKKAVIFDLDGTLWDSFSHVANAWNEVFEKHGLGSCWLKESKMRSLMGKTLPEFAAALFPEKEEDAVLELLNECCIHANEMLREHGCVLYEGVQTVLMELGSRYGLFIVSNCQSGYIEAFLDYYEMGKLFADCECSGRTGMKKADNIRLIMERNKTEAAVYVGDTETDQAAAERAGIPFVHASYGYGTAKLPEGRINTIGELPELLDKIMERGKHHE